MAYVKRMVMHGFKSFAKKTEVQFDTGINVILGPNGSGKSNISDALCFVLGRLSIKSIRAAKARNLIFMGSKYVKPAKEAYVELVFDNTDKSFSIEKDEISLKRIVRYNGQSVYKINDETKTRSEVIELLAQAGIDPHGANIVLQGQIQSVVRMHPDERRKVIEEVAGIAIYETRKEKSLKELEKTDERLKEISTILRERTAFLKNLEREKSQAQRYKELESKVKRSKATIFHKRKEDKEKELGSMIKSIEAKTKDKDKIKEQGDKVRGELEGISGKIEEINKHIEKATGLEQENLHNEIANLRAEIEGLKVRKENYEHRRDEIEKRISELGKGIPEIELEIKDLKLKSPLMAKKSESLRKKKEELAEIEIERKKLLNVKTELNSLRERIRDKEGQVKRAELESENLLKQLEENSADLKFRTEEEVSKKASLWKKSLLDKRKDLEDFNKKELENEKIIVLAESEIERAKEIRKKIENIDTCPLCQTKMTEQHRAHVFKDTEDNIEKFGKKREVSIKNLDEIKE
ncbi:MAG: AAA family ATPase, partial [Nanoarchaeota archaeon]